MSKRKTPDRFETFDDSYEVLDQIGEGGSGVVWRVRDLDGQEFAMKVLDPAAHGMSRQKIKRFKRELEFCSKEEFRHIVRVLDRGRRESDGQLFYVMPFYPATLRSMMKARISAERVLPLFYQMLDGVEEAHLKGVIHRDLKPENILYDPRSEILVIADFGCARFAEHLLLNSLKTRTGERLGNIGYSAPEQKKPGVEVDERTDIFALGSILNEMFTGDPVHGPDYPKIEGVKPEFSYVDQVIAGMVKQRPDERFRTIDDVKRKLIALGDDAVSRQRLSELHNKVVPATETDDILVLRPPKVKSIDYRNGELLLDIGKGITPEWIHQFQHLTQAQSMGPCRPEAVRFANGRVSLPVTEHLAADGLRLFKTWIAQANSQYSAQVVVNRHRREEEQRERLRAEAEAEEKRLAVLARLHEELDR